MNSCELVTFTTSVSIALYQCMSAEELADLATVLTQLSVTLSTMLANSEGTQEGDVPLDYI